MEKNKRKKRALPILLGILASLALTALIFMHFGGFTTGKSADPAEFKAAAGTVGDITVPGNVSIVALGEATHGNAEFQALKLDVFKRLVETCGVRALALEGDYGGCEQVNRYIHGGDGTAAEAAAAIGFAIYRTDEMAALISYMRAYNDTAAAGDDLRFYGFDMQRCGYNVRFLTESCRALGVDTGEIEKLSDGEDWSNCYDTAAREDILLRAKAALEKKNAPAKDVRYADILLQNCALQTVLADKSEDYGVERDRYMAENTLWILEQERALGYQRIFVTAHDGHIAKWGSFDQMGKFLSDALGSDYFSIGTDFYKTRCNLPLGSDGRRTKQTFYSHDPLAKAAKKAGLPLCYLDFEKVGENTPLSSVINGYTYMGTLGEGYSLLMRLLPPSYRLFQPPAELYDGMIFVSDAHPTKILPAE